MHYGMMELKPGLLCALPLLGAIEGAVAALVFCTNWMPVVAKVLLMSVYLAGVVSTGTCWCAILCNSQRLLRLWLGYQQLIITVCYVLGFYVLMSGAVDLRMKASEENYESLKRLLLGSSIYLVGPFELYTWKRVKHFRHLLRGRSHEDMKTLESVNSPESELELQTAIIEKEPASMNQRGDCSDYD